jgi:transcriptional regulator with XRE-family HTH domain
MAQAPRELTPDASALHHFGAILRRHRTDCGLSQQQLGRVVHVSGHLIGKIEIAVRWPTLELARQLDRALGTGGELVELLPLVEQSRQQSGRPLPDSQDGAAVGNAGGSWDEPDDGTGEDVHRRDMWRVAVAAVALPALDRLTRYLITYPPAAVDVRGTLSDARRGVASVKRQYQACRYSAVLEELPQLLSVLRVLPDTLSDGERNAAWVLEADTYQVVGSVLLKLEEVPLATLAADRSMIAAQRSGDRVAVASSARVITHALMSAGHPDRAYRFAADAANRLVLSGPRLPREGIAVAGALLLRGGVAAARHNDRAAAETILDEAAAMAREIPDDGNDRWTGFNPTNVLLHRVNTALALGDAGTAVHLARQVDVTKIELTERKASLFLDVAQAYTQWGKWDQAIGALRRAAQTAPQEVGTRATARRLIEDLARGGPGSVRSAALEVAARSGVRL